MATACLAMSAIGNFVPPMIIFPRARLTEQLKKGAPAETLFCCNKSGWTTIDDMNKYFDHFLSHTRPTESNPILLLLDGHSSHTKNMAFLEKAKRNHVDVLSFPPHCSHRLQPLDVSFMGPLKTHLAKAIDDFLKEHPGKVVTMNELSELFGKAYMKTTNATVAVNGFAKTGIVPLNRNIFSDDLFAPADVTDIDIEANHEDSEVSGVPGESQSGSSKELCDDKKVKNGPGDDVVTTGYDPEAGDIQDFVLPGVDLSDGKIVKNEPGDDDKENCAPGPSKAPNKGFTISPAAILPLPKSQTRKLSRKRKEKAADLTSSPYRAALKEAQASKDIENIKKANKRRPRANTKQLAKRLRLAENSQEDFLCELCGKSFMQSEKGKGWIKCGQCHAWYHDCHKDDCPTCSH